MFAARLARRYPVFNWWCGPCARVVAWLVLAACVVHPPHGTGVPLCFTRSTFGVDCPGCGLSRSVSCHARGMFADGFAYHPFGVVALGMFIFIAGVSLLPRRRQIALARGMQHRGSACRTITLLGLALFLTYGVLRLVGLAPAAGADGPGAAAAGAVAWTHIVGH